VRTILPCANVPNAISVSPSASFFSGSNTCNSLRALRLDQQNLPRSDSHENTCADSAALADSVHQIPTDKPHRPRLHPPGPVVVEPAVRIRMFPDIPEVVPSSLQLSRLECDRTTSRSIHSSSFPYLVRLTPPQWTNDLRAYCQQQQVAENRNYSSCLRHGKRKLNG
jgi:hypothetical protein